MTLDQIQIVVMRYNEPACEELSRWLAHTGMDWRYGVSDYEIDVARNKNIQRFLKDDVPKGKTHLLSLNHDMVPLPETTPILTLDGDLLYCASSSSRGSIEHLGDKQFSSACWRASEKLLSSFGPPWFRVGHSGDITERTYCDCMFFKDRAQEVGFDAQMVGIIGHKVSVIVFPDPESPQDKYKFLWEADLDYDKLLEPPPDAPVPEELKGMV